MESINIGGFDFKVDFETYDSDELGQTFGKPTACWGIMSFGENPTIFVANDAKNGRENSTFIHEIIEALNTVYKIGLRHWQIEKLELAIANTLYENNVRIEKLLDKTE